MKNTMTRRVLSLLLSITLLFSQTGLTALAADVEAYTAGSLCEHHPAHMPECGYAEGTPCTHEHTEDCCRTETLCTFIASVDGDVSENTATPSDIPKQTEHKCTEDSGCITKTLNCKHTHDDTCGFAKPSLCTYQCKICGAMDSGNQGASQEHCSCEALCTEGFIDTDCPVCGATDANLSLCKGNQPNIAPGASTITITGFDELETAIQQQTVEPGTELESLNLSTTLQVQGYEVSKDTAVVDSGTPPNAVFETKAITIEGVTWELDPTNEVNAGNDKYDPAQGSYAFTPVLQLGYTLAEGISLPEIWVMVGAPLLLAGNTGDFTVTGGTINTDYIYESNTLTIKSNTAITISGTTTTDKIAVADGVIANITLNGVSIDRGSEDYVCAFEMANDADCNLTLAGSSTNTLKSGWERAGLRTPDGAALTIGGTGTLNVSGGIYAAGIGGHGAEDAGSITINSGTVTATCQDSAAAIGGGAGGIVIINGGTVTATGGGYSACGIGTRSGLYEGTITITGGVVIADSNSGIGVRCKELIMNGTGFLSAKTSEATRTTITQGFLLADGSATVVGAVTLPSAPAVTIDSGKSLTVKSGATLTVPSDVTLTVNGLVQNSGIIANSGTISGGYLVGNAVSGGTSSLNTPVVGNGRVNVADGNVILYEAGYCVGNTVYAYDVKSSSVTLYGTTSQNSVTVSAQQTIPVTLENLSVDVRQKSLCAFTMPGANVTLTLTGENRLQSASGKAGLLAPAGATLFIRGNGSLTAVGGSFGAGIGGDQNRAGGNITISGGTVTANASDYGAGIGGGYNGAGGNITISSGTVTANASGFGAGIGGGYNGAGGDITISGGYTGASGTFSTSGSGNAFIAASSIGDKRNQSSWSGVIFEGDNGKIYGSPTLTTYAEISSGKTLTIDKDKTLTIDNGVTLTNNGTIQNNGTLINNGNIENHGSISGSIGGSGTVVNAIKAGDFTLTSDSTLTSGTDYSHADNTLTIKSSTAITISGTTTTDKIAVAGGVTANIKLNGVDIQFSNGDWSNSGTCAFEVAGDAVCNLTLTGSSTLKSGSTKAGLQVQSKDNNTATLVITETSTGTLTANGGTNGAGIGGGRNESGGNITIHSGTVRGQGGDGGAGIGGGFDFGGRPGGGTIIISGGAIHATPGYMAAAIGGGAGHSGGNTNVTISGGTVTAQGAIGGGSWEDGGGEAGKFYTGTGGSAFIVASSIGDKSSQSSWSGVIFEGDSGKVYGSPTLGIDATIPAGKTLTIDNDKTLTIGSGVTLTNNGTIVNNGTITNNGTILNYGTITGNAPEGGTLIKSSKVEVSFAKSDGTALDTPNTAVYGNTIQITATVGKKVNTKSLRSSLPAVDTVDFYLGDVADGNKLNESPVGVSNGTATLNIALTGEKWKAGNKTIIADFGGTTNSLLDSQGSAQLTVTKAAQNATSVAVSSTSLTYGGAAPTITEVTVSDSAAVTYSAVTEANGSTPSDVASISDTTITINKTGAFYVKAAIAETADYAAKTIYSAAITVNPAAQDTVSAPALGSNTATGVTLTHNIPGGTGNGMLKYGYATEDSAGNINNWQTALAFTGLDPNTQYNFFAKREADDNYKEAISTSLSVTTNKGTQTVTTGIGYGKASFTYGDAAQALVTTPVFSQSGTITYASSDSNVISIDKTSGKITFHKVGTATITATNTVINYENKTSTVEITVNNADQAAPSVTAVAETFAEENDGKITGTTTAMEYSTTTVFASATDCTGTEITGLAPGTYYVRYKAKDNYNASAFATVTIVAGEARTYTLTDSAPTFTEVTYGYSQPAAQNITITNAGNSTAAISSVTVSGTAFEIGGSDSTVTAGGSITTWTVQPKAGLNVGTYAETITVTYNNSATATASVSFTVNKATPFAPSAPTQPNQEDKTTHNSITIDTASGQKYIYTTENSCPAINGDAGWTDGTGSTHTFTGLTRDTNYYIWTYIAETINCNNSTVSTALEVKTENEPVASVNVLGITAPVAKTTPDTSAENGTGWTAGNVSWYTDTPTSFTGDSFDYETVYTAKVTLTAAEGYQFPDTVTAQVGGNGATVSDKGTSSITVSYTYPTTNERGQTAVPSFADASYAMQTATATAATFALTSDTTNTNYKLFNQLTGGSEVSSGLNMNVSDSTLTLTFTAAPAQDTAYYVSATKGDDKESTRATITVKAYIATTGISLNKNELALNVGGSETLLAAVTPDAATNKTATWTSSDSSIASVGANGKVTAIKAGTATITAKAADGQTATCTTNVKASSGGGSTGGDNDTPSHSPPTVITHPATQEQPNPPTNGESKVDGTVDKGGNATVKVPDKAVTDAITAAKKQAGQNGISVTLNVTLKQTANSLTVTISKAALDRLIAEGVKELKFTSSLISFGFNLEALKEIQKSVTGDLTIAAKKLEAKTLSKDAQAAIGNRPVFDFAMQSGGKSISDFGKGRASVWMPYAPANNEAEGSLQAVYVDDKGGVEWIIGSSYNKDAKALLFSTDHFSIYGVGYQTVPVFTDTVNHWAKDDIEFVAARGLLSGTGATTFSPDTAMTRGMFVTALWRLAGIPQAGEGVAFTDVPSTAYYSNAVKWAAKNGIVSRTSATTFVPDKAITRQEMAVIMQNYTKALGYTIPQTRAAVIFADSSGIGSWAAEAVKAMQMAWIINGKDSNKFDPTGTATRAEVSAVLRRYVELVIDSSTAQGWMQNDSGQWMYYENGKPVTGKRDIGGTTYTFGHYGEIADMPKNLTYESYIVKKSDSWWKIACEQNCNIYELARVNGKTIFSIIYEGDILKTPKKG